ncbi:hypothetical protein PHK61_08440 [Actinomycetospora lutea]|nr:hypothetical protein [Actinomycetospora lutea]MDD7938444.1 hypothetical protein [Actinomycetospora lutea]
MLRTGRRVVADLLDLVDEGASAVTLTVLDVLAPPAGHGHDG